MKFAMFFENRGCLDLWGYGTVNEDDLLAVLNKTKRPEDVRWSGTACQDDFPFILRWVLSDLSEVFHLNPRIVYEELDALVGEEYAILFYEDYVEDETILWIAQHYSREQKKEDGGAWYKRVDLEALYNRLIANKQAVG